MNITLKPATVDEAESFLIMLIECFTAHRENYGDSPFWYSAVTAEAIENLRERFADPSREYLWIMADGETVGGIRVTRWAEEPGRYRLTTIMLLPQRQNRGIGQQAMRLLEARYPDARTWELDTILQDERDLHFYEKLGYRRVGEPRVVNERLSLAEYKKWVNPILNHYGRGNEDSRFERRHSKVEYLTTMRYIERYLTLNARIIEIGAGTGRYSLALADKGYVVDAVELSETNIEAFHAKIKPEQNISLRQGDALDLSELADGAYDITLLLGPLYHLFTPEDKRRVIAEALRVTKPHGVVFAAYCISDASVVLSGFQRKVFNIAEYIERGKIDSRTFDTHSVPEDVFELVRREDVDELMQGFDVQRLHYIGTDLFSYYVAPALAEMSEEEFALYLQYHYAVCERADMVGATAHALDIFRKNGVGDARIMA